MSQGVQIMITGAALSAPFFWLNSVYFASGHLNIWTLGYATQFLALLSVAWWAVPIWGFSGMALLTAIGKAGFTAAMLWIFYHWLSSERRNNRDLA
jgi:O-antigen/teichoic acid export membrane protein